MADDVRFSLIARSEVTDALVDGMLGLFARAFGRWPSLDPEVPLADHLRWKMESPDAPYAAIVGHLASRLVVARVVVQHRLLVRGVPRVTLDTPDLAVEPEFQGRGISTACVAWRDARLSPLCDLEIDEGRHPRLLARRRERGDVPITNRLRALYRVPHPNQLPRALLRERRFPTPVVWMALQATAAVAALRGTFRRRTPLAGSIATVRRFDPRVDAFCERAAAAFDLLYSADHRRLNWRYCDRRAGPFGARALEQGGEILGYAVHRIGRPHGLLVDLLALPGRDDVAEALARDAVERLIASGALDVTCWLPERHPYRRVLRRLGFLTLPSPIPQRFRGQRMPTAEFAFLGRPDARLHLTMGSTDLV
jgi:GNAT superfamily N-acetyltransferase